MASTSGSVLARDCTMPILLAGREMTIGRPYSVFEFLPPAVYE